MPNVQVHRYEEPVAGFVGWIEPDDRSWIVFVPVDGSPIMWTKRDETGAVVGEAAK